MTRILALDNALQSILVRIDDQRGQFVDDVVQNVGGHAADELSFA